MNEETGIRSKLTVMQTNLYFSLLHRLLPNLLVIGANLGKNKEKTKGKLEIKDEEAEI